MQDLGVVSETTAPALNMQTQQNIQQEETQNTSNVKDYKENPTKNYNSEKQSKYDSDIYNYDSELDILMKDYEFLKQFENDWLGAFMPQNSFKLNQIAGKYEGNKAQGKLQNMESRMAELRKLTQDIKDRSDYDPRDDNQRREDYQREEIQKREDTAYQRAAKDMQEAQLNKGLMFGSGGPAASGGGPSGSGKSKKDKEKKEKKERDYNATVEAKERERLFANLITMLGMGGMNMTSNIQGKQLVSDSIRNNQASAMEIANNNQVERDYYLNNMQRERDVFLHKLNSKDSKAEKEKKKTPWLGEYLDEIKRMK